MRGLLLTNLGTPAQPTTGPVRTYLKQFLNDPRVIDINPLGRKALLNLIILPTRPQKSAEAYRQIWTDRGSPLLFHTADLAKKVAAELGDDWQVEYAMRYGDPNASSALEAFRRHGVDDIVVLPLYPQYASSSTGSTLEEIYSLAASKWNVPRLSTIGAFYDDDDFITAWITSSKDTLEEFAPDHVLFSFHGLPERHIKKSDEVGNFCLEKDNCCDNIVDANRNCYRAQCFATARLLAAGLGVQDKHTVCFQSRLGRTPWIQPYTDQVIDELAAQGTKRLAVYCPAFVADCLETLEEIGMRAKEQFIEAGGEDLTLIPSLNSQDHWVKAVASMVKRHAS